MRRGDVCWGDLGPARGSAPAHRRPVVVIQSNAFNRSAIRTVVVVALTSNQARAEHPGNVVVPSAGTGLSKPSVVNVTQLSTVDRSGLDAPIGRIPPHLMRKVDEGVRLVLGL